MNDRASRNRSHRRTRDRAFILLIIGLGLLMPPVAGIFHLDAKILGVPVTLVYLFVVWAGLIVGTAVLARPLSRSSPASGSRR